MAKAVPQLRSCDQESAAHVFELTKHHAETAPPEAVTEMMEQADFIEALVPFEHAAGIDLGQYNPDEELPSEAFVAPSPARAKAISAFQGVTAKMDPAMVEKVAGSDATKGMMQIASSPTVTVKEKTGIFGSIKNVFSKAKDAVVEGLTAVKDKVVEVAKGAKDAVVTGVKTVANMADKAMKATAVGRFLLDVRKKMAEGGLLFVALRRQLTDQLSLSKVQNPAAWISTAMQCGMEVIKSAAYATTEVAVSRIKDKCDETGLTDKF